jgi:hypothetical protein
MMMKMTRDLPVMTRDLPVMTRDLPVMAAVDPSPGHGENAPPPPLRWISGNG